MQEVELDSLPMRRELMKFGDQDFKGEEGLSCWLCNLSTFAVRVHYSLPLLRPKDLFIVREGSERSHRQSMRIDRSREIVHQ